ncbi:MAG TPA: hypothetical protein VGR26_14910 [Acidimicrobiales bacterium]|nr:hypothetical protein [Acidimicrobiales bacterium]
MSAPPTVPGLDTQRVMALLTAVDGGQHDSTRTLLRETTQADVLYLAQLFNQTLRSLAAVHGVEPEKALLTLALAVAVEAAS